MAVKLGLPFSVATLAMCIAPRSPQVVAHPRIGTGTLMLAHVREPQEAKARTGKSVCSATRCTTVIVMSTIEAAALRVGKFLNIRPK